jgi:hypothetical protein
MQARMARRKNHMIGGRPVDGGFLGRAKRKGSKPSPGSNLKTSYITQPVDHFDKNNTKTYQQVSTEVWEYCVVR